MFTCVPLEESLWMRRELFFQLSEVCYTQVTTICGYEYTVWVSICYLLVTNCMSNILNTVSGVRVLAQPQRPAMALLHLLEYTHRPGMWQLSTRKEQNACCSLNTSLLSVWGIYDNYSFKLKWKNSYWDCLKFILHANKDTTLWDRFTLFTFSKRLNNEVSQ